jgi:hypothetical protein
VLESRLYRPTDYYRSIKPHCSQLATSNRLQLVPSHPQLPSRYLTKDESLIYRLAFDSGSEQELDFLLRENHFSIQIVKLVCDYILEINCGGVFRTGIEFYAWYQHLNTVGLSQDMLARLDEDALCYAQSLDILNRVDLAERLYSYNHEPLTPYWKRTLNSLDSAAAYLKLWHLESILNASENYWYQEHFSIEGWFVLSKLYPVGVSIPAPHKLYISPMIDSLVDILPSVIQVIACSRAESFKVGATINNLLRPDKLIVYFSQKADLLKTVDSLVRCLSGARVQGVPFTEQLDNRGILSSAIEPDIESTSWRHQITILIANTLISARLTYSEELGIERWQFALARYALEGSKELRERVWGRNIVLN